MKYVSSVATLGRHHQEEEDLECLFDLNRIHQNIASTKVAISDLEVKEPKVLVRDNQLDSVKSDVPASNICSSSE